jgi:hypothetical protein
MNKLDDILTIPTLCLIIVLAVLTLLVRKLAEAVWPVLSDKTPLTMAERVWEEFALPACPAIMGTLFCWLITPIYYPYPAVACVTTLSRVLYGFSLGWFSSGGYRGISAVLKKKWNVSLPGDTDPPPRMPSLNGTGR